MTTLKEMKDEVLAQIAIALDDLVINAKQNGNVHVKQLEVKLTASFPLTPDSDSDAVVNVTKTVTLKPQP